MVYEEVLPPLGSIPFSLYFPFPHILSYFLTSLYFMWCLLNSLKCSLEWCYV